MSLRARFVLAGMGMALLLLLSPGAISEIRLPKLVSFVVPMLALKDGSATGEVGHQDIVAHRLG